MRWPRKCAQTSSATRESPRWRSSGRPLPRSPWRCLVRTSRSTKPHPRRGGAGHHPVEPRASRGCPRDPRRRPPRAGGRPQARWPRLRGHHSAAPRRRRAHPRRGGHHRGWLRGQRSGQLLQRQARHAGHGLPGGQRDPKRRGLHRQGRRRKIPTRGCPRPSRFHPEDDSVLLDQRIDLLLRNAQTGLVLAIFVLALPTSASHCGSRPASPSPFSAFGAALFDASVNMISLLRSS